MTKLVHQIVKKCIKCPHARYFDDAKGKGYDCGRGFYRLIPTSILYASIPDWCQLPDAPE